MAKATKHRLAHICILVRDIDAAIEHYTGILSAVAPRMLLGKVAKQEGNIGKDRYLTAFFPAVGNACDIQLLQPLGAESPLGKRLAKYGEGVHHIAFATSHLEDTFKQLKEKEITLHGDYFINDGSNPALRLVWIHPRYAHGVLIEVMESYQLKDGLLTEA